MGHWIREGNLLFSFQTLIGTVKREEEDLAAILEAAFQTLIGTVKREFVQTSLEELKGFQTLIGTVKRRPL